MTNLPCKNSEGYEKWLVASGRDADGTGEIADAWEREVRRRYDVAAPRNRSTDFLQDQRDLA